MHWFRILFTTSFIITGVVCHRPVCIIGAGPAGLSTAMYLQEKGYRTVVFEKLDRVGGRCHTFHVGENLVDTGAYFVDIFTERFVSIIERFGQRTATVPASLQSQFVDEDGHFDNNRLNNSLFSEPVQTGFRKYFDILKSYPDITNVLVEGLQQPHPELAVPFATFLEQNDLSLLYPHFIWALSNEGYGSMTETPTIYVMRFLTENFIRYFIFREQGVVVLPDGWQTLWEAVADTLTDVRIGVNIIHIHRSYGRSAVVYEKNGRRMVRTCSRIVIAFPQLLDRLEAITHLDRPEREVFEKVVINKYFTSVVVSPIPPPKSRYLMVFEHGNGQLQFSEPKGSGEVVAIIQQAPGVSTAYSWIAGESSTPTTPFDSSIAQGRVEDDFKTMTGRDGQVVTFITHDYFPHVRSESVRKGWHINADMLQGYRNTFYTGALFDFDMVSGAVRAAHYMVDRYF